MSAKELTAGREMLAAKAPATAKTIAPKGSAFCTIRVFIMIKFKN
jgi:hypothetical protein